MKIYLLVISICLIIDNSALAKEFILKDGKTENDAPAKKNETVRMVVLGDSLTETLGWTTLLSKKFDDELPEAIEFG